MKHRAFTLLEVLVAFCLMVVTATGGFTLFRAAAREARRTEERLAAQQILIDFCEWLRRAGTSNRQQLKVNEGRVMLKMWLAARISNMPPLAAAQEAGRISGICQAFQGHVDEGVDGTGRLARISLALEFPKESPVRLTRLVRTGKGREAE
jgi:type II secretory pathway pseudopilin PulG